MEQAEETGLVESVEPEIAAFADAGLYEWRTASDPIDVALLGRLPAVQERLADLGPGASEDVDARLDAIDIAIEQAIGRLPQPYSNAAEAHFGFVPVPDGEEPPTKSVREDAAADCFPRITSGGRWYIKPNGKHLGLKPRDLVVGLVAASLCGVADPMAYLVARARGVKAQPLPSSAAPQPPTSQIERPPWRLLAGLGVVAVAGVAAVVIAITSSGGEGGTPVERAERRAIQAGVVPPPQGWAVNAQTGKPSPPSTLPKRFGPNSGQIAGGNVFWSCVATTKPCSIPKRGEPTIAKAGDQLLLRLRLHNPSDEPLAEARIWIATQTGSDSISLTANLEWPTTTPDRIDSNGAKTTIRFRDGKPHGLEYLPRSAMLYDSSQEAGPEGRMIARLPEGLLSYGGVVLTNVGAPRGCWDCDLAYIRYIDFSMRVT